MNLNYTTFKQQLFSNADQHFNEYALWLFQYQVKHNAIYCSFVDHLGINPNKVNNIYDIPFLPISFFKTHKLSSFPVEEAEIIFSSSGTTQQLNSKHFVRHKSWYKQSFTQAFRYFYGNVNQFCIVALLPAYLERTGSSLVYMTNQLVQQTQHPKSGFYLYNYEELAQVLQNLESQQQKTLLLGVSFALWDLAEQFPQTLANTTIMETGGMKGKRKELIRRELHKIFKSAFGVNDIHSEYGMTELLSQAYSKGEGIFYCPPWMKVLTRELNDPFNTRLLNQTGGINIIDLANIDSCAFIATQDLGRCYADGGFEVLGRFDNSDIRGCNLMVS